MELRTPLKLIQVPEIYLHFWIVNHFSLKGSGKNVKCDFHQNRRLHPKVTVKSLFSAKNFRLSGNSSRQVVLRGAKMPPRPPMVLVFLAGWLHRHCCLWYRGLQADS